MDLNVDYERLIACMTPEEQEELDVLLTAEIIDHKDGERERVVWTPFSGSQTEAVLSLADLLYFGGQVGGGKTSFLCGLALTEHQRSLLCRKEYTDIAGIHQELEEIIGHRGGLSEGKRRWRIFNAGKQRLIEFGAASNLLVQQSFQGRAHDLKGLDEVSHFTLAEFQFFSAWNRSKDPRQRCRAVACGNPPMTPEGMWVNEYWGPWLDPKHGNPAKPGELRWFARLEDKDVEVETGAPFLHKGEMVYPKSRTFIPSGLEDNPYYGTDYKGTLQSLPEPWRSILLKGDYTANTQDHPWQVIPTEHVLMANERWRQRRRPEAQMDSLGLDPVRGGGDELVAAPRYGNYIDELYVKPGKEFPNGQSVAAKILPMVQESTAINVDVIGVGSSPVDFLSDAHDRTYALNSAAGSNARDKLELFGFMNKRAEWTWKLREALDPVNGDDLALPPDPKLTGDLTALRWRPTTKGVQIEDKDSVKARLGRSPDRGDAVIYSLVQDHVIPLVLPASLSRNSYWRS